MLKYNLDTYSTTYSWPRARRPCNPIGHFHNDVPYFRKTAPPLYVGPYVHLHTRDTFHEKRESASTKSCNNPRTTQSFINHPPIAHSTNPKTSAIMPRGGEYDDGPTIASDNAIESGDNKIAGAPKGDSDVSFFPLP